MLCLVDVGRGAVSRASPMSVSNCGSVVLAATLSFLDYGRLSCGHGRTECMQCTVAFRNRTLESQEESLGSKKNHMYFLLIFRACFRHLSLATLIK